MLFVNVYFRARVLKAYKELNRAGIEFDARDMLNETKIASLVARYPEQGGAIRQFCGGIRKSMSMASGLILLITLLGAILMYFR